jgi:hypothetical protein
MRSADGAMSKPRPTVGKRARQDQKRARAQAKVERKAERQSTVVDLLPHPTLTEPELMEELAGLHRALEAGELPLGDFEEQRDHIRSQLERLV